MADNITVKDGSGSSVTMKTKDVGAGVQASQVIFSDAAGAVLLGARSSVSLTRTADTSAYLANDIVGAATGSTAALSFTSIGPAGGNILITCSEFAIFASSVISGETSYRLHLYDATPPSASGDNAAWDLPSGDRANYLGFIDLGTPTDVGSTLYVQQIGINKQIKLASGVTTLFAYLVTLGAHTPTSARQYSITLSAVPI